jgi:hypothetical protein
MGGREAVEGQQVSLGILQQPGDLGRMRAQLLDHLGQPDAGLASRGGGEDPADRAGDQRLLRPADVAEHVAQEVHGAALPRAAQHLGDRGLEAGVGVGDGELDALQPTNPQAAQELAPEALGLGLADVQAGHGAAAVRDAVAASIATLPEQLRRSLTWDQGAEMAQHASCASTPACRCSSAIRTAPGSVVPTRTL